MSNGNAIVDPKEFQTRVSAMIKQQMFDMIPDQRLEEMVGAEIKAFFDPNTKMTLAYEKGGYNTDSHTKVVTGVSPFRHLVWTECANWYRSKIREVLFDRDSPFFTEIRHLYNANGGQQIEAEMGEAIQVMLTELSKNMAANFFGGQFAMQASSLKEQLIQEMIAKFPHLTLPPRY